MYPHKRRQRKRSCRRFRWYAGAVARMAEYRQITRASPPALWVSGRSRATPSAKGVAMRAHTERHTLPRRPVRSIGPDVQCSTSLVACHAKAVTVSQSGGLACGERLPCPGLTVNETGAQAWRAPSTSCGLRPVDGRPGLFRLPSVTARRHGEYPADHRRYDSIERLGVCLLPPIAYRIRGSVWLNYQKRICSCYPAVPRRATYRTG